MLTVTVIFVLVYFGMLLGGLPFLQIDRTGIALLGCIALIVSHSVTIAEAAAAIHWPTMILLFSFMVLAAQMRLGGFYDWLIARLGALELRPPVFLAVLVLVVAMLAAVFSNDIICLSMAPVLIDICLQRRLNPVPFLLGLACAANIGSAATLIGNPQNMLIGGKLGLSFGGYLQAAAGPVLAGIVVTWLVIVFVWRRGWGYPDRIRAVAVAVHSGEKFGADGWQAAKGFTVAVSLFILFLGSDWPRDLLALSGAGLLLLSRKLHSRNMLGLVDWQVLVLFGCLFVVNAALEQTGLPRQAVRYLADVGIDLHRPAVLYGIAFVLSNLVSNVPAIMLLLPTAAPEDGVLLAISSTFAGNLWLVGSIANIIVIDAAARRNIFISWRQHAGIGVPVTLLTLGLAGGYLFA